MDLAITIAGRVGLFVWGAISTVMATWFLFVFPFSSDKRTDLLMIGRWMGLGGIFAILAMVGVLWITSRDWWGG